MGGWWAIETYNTTQYLKNGIAPICNCERIEYNRRHVLSRAIAKGRKSTNSIANNTPKPDGAHIEFIGRNTIRAGADFGKIRTQFGAGGDAETRYLACLRSRYRNLTICGIKVHIARKRIVIRKRYDVQFPIRRKTYNDIGAINRHLYKKQCPRIKEDIRN